MNAPNYVVSKLLSNEFVFFYLKFFDFMWHLCWVYLNFKLILIKIIMCSNCSVTSFKHLWLIFKNIWSFNEMKMEINVINSNEIFTKIVKNQNKRKRNFIIYHFLAKSNPHERIDLLITTSVHIYQTKKIQ